jgi:hypothetical protein
MDEGTRDGHDVGTEIGDDEGIDVGTEMGIMVGTDDGTPVGRDVGPTVGADVGRDVGRTSVKIACPSTNTAEGAVRIGRSNTTAPLPLSLLRSFEDISHLQVVLVSE